MASNGNGNAWTTAWYSCSTYVRERVAAQGVNFILISPLLLSSTFVHPFSESRAREREKGRKRGLDTEVTVYRTCVFPHP